MVDPLNESFQHGIVINTLNIYQPREIQFNQIIQIINNLLIVIKSL